VSVENGNSTQVEVGDVIGTSGGTGVTTTQKYRLWNRFGAHLHFSVYKDGISSNDVVNPYGWYTVTGHIV